MVATATKKPEGMALTDTREPIMDRSDTTTPRFVVKTSAACMPATCWGRYARIAVLAVEPGTTEVTMISERARGVIRVVQTWEKLNVGTTERCAYALALVEARELAAALNADACDPGEFGTIDAIDTSILLAEAA